SNVSACGDCTTTRRAGRRQFLQWHRACYNRLLAYESTHQLGQNMPQSISIHITAKSVALLLAAVALVWLIANFSSILVILFVAILLAVAITPLVGRLEELRVPRTLAIVLSYAGLFGML